MYYLNKLKMKRLKFHRAIVAIAMMLIGWLPSLAHDFKVDGIYYNKINSTNVEVTSGDFLYGRDVIIPSSVKHNGTIYSVTCIGDKAFYNNENLISIEIPNSVTSIGKSAFSLCKSLASIEIPNSVTSIGNEAFYGCDSLTSIEIPNSVTSIGKSAYRGCDSLTSVVIGNSVTSIGEAAFFDCSSLTSIEIPNSVNNIGSSTFYGCNNLISVVIGNSVTSIGKQAFYYCESLTSIVIGNNVTSIGDWAFQTCTSLKSIEIPNSVTSIGEGVFDGCSSLTKITCLAMNPPTIESNTFSKYSAELHVPAGSKSTYESAEYWKNFSNIIELEENNTSSRLFINDFSINSGEIKELTIELENDIPFTSFQADLYLPKGLEIINENETNIFNLSDRKATDHVIVSEKLSSGAIRLLSYSPSLKEFAGTSGALINFKVKASDDLVGSYEISLKDVIFATKEKNEYQFEQTVTNVECLMLAKSISLNEANVILEVAESFKLEAYVMPEMTNNKYVSWKSSNDEVATVDKNGVVTAVKVGEATITATTTDGTDLSALCKVNVIQTFATSITINKTEVRLKASEQTQLTAIILPETVTYKTVVWESSNENVAIVDANGVVTAMSVGEATITATTSDGSNLSASTKIIVDPTIAESITLTIESTTLKANETIELRAIVLPELTTNKSVAWQSSDELVAIVDANGIITAIGVGEATITATTTDESNLSAVCIVTVEATLGDVNNDANVNITDIMTIANYILERNPAVFIFEAADVTFDSKINITDIVGVAEIILNENTSNTSMLKNQAPQNTSANLLFIEDCSIQAGETKTIAVNLTNDIAFSGFQADIKLPEGLELCQEDDEYMISLSDRKGNDHVLTSAMRSDGTIRVLSYSMNLKDYAGTEGALIYLTVKASENFVGDYEICINNIIFTQANLTEYSLEPTICHLTGITGIEGMDNEIVIATIGDNIVVKNAPFGSNVRVYAADGAMIATEIATDGSVVVEAPIKGIYVVAVDGKSFKVMVK